MTLKDFATHFWVTTRRLRTSVSVYEYKRTILAFTRRAVPGLVQKGEGKFAPLLGGRFGTVAAMQV